MSGAQIVMARQSSCQELPTAPMTSPMVDLVSDKYLFVYFWSKPGSASQAKHQHHNNHAVDDCHAVTAGEGDLSLNSVATEEMVKKIKMKRKMNIASRNRRIAYIVSMVFGSFIGATLHRFAGSWVVVLVAVVCKVIAIVMVGMAKADP